MAIKQHKRALISAIVGVLAVAAAWGTGRFQGMQETNEVREELQSLQPELARLKRLESRRHLDLSLDALDQRNFGIAQEHLVSAARRLKESDPPRDGKLHALAEEIANTSLVAADDFADQRNMIRDYITRLDESVPPEPAAGEKKKNKPDDPGGRGP